MSSSKVIVNNKLCEKSKMAAKKAAKTRPWDNILRWEHKISFTRHLEDCKNVG